MTSTDSQETSPKVFRISEIDGNLSFTVHSNVNYHERLESGFIISLSVRSADADESGYLPSYEFYRLFGGKERESSFQLVPNEFGKSVGFVRKCEDGQTGNFFIFSCSCGDCGCAGWFKGVQVKKCGREVIWSFPDFEGSPIVIFPLTEYLNFWARLCRAMTFYRKTIDRQIRALLPKEPYLLQRTKPYTVYEPVGISFPRLAIPLIKTGNGDLEFYAPLALDKIPLLERLGIAKEIGPKLIQSNYPRLVYEISQKDGNRIIERLLELKPSKKMLKDFEKNGLTSEKVE